MVGKEIKQILSEFLFRWYMSNCDIDIFTPFIDDYGLNLLHSLPKYIFYNKQNPIRIITRSHVSEGRWPPSNLPLLEKRKDYENCSNCRRRNPDISYGDCLGCIQSMKYLVFLSPKKNFHAKFYAGISKKYVEIILTSHNLTYTGQNQLETIGLIKITKKEYYNKYLKPFSLDFLEREGFHV